MLLKRIFNKHSNNSRKSFNEIRVGYPIFVADKINNIIRVGYITKVVRPNKSLKVRFPNLNNIEQYCDFDGVNWIIREVK